MKFVIITLILLVSILIYKKASGNLKINLINISSLSFYSLLLFQFIGVTLVFLGYKDHYLIEKISNNDVIEKTYWLLAYCMIVLPFAVHLCNKKIYKIKDIDKKYIDNIKMDIEIEGKSKQKKIYIIIAICSIICLIATIYVFYCIGYIPLFKFFEKGFDYAVARISNSRNFAGNIYIKNIIMLTITPVLSHIAYIYMRKTKEYKWIILFVILFILNIFIKTYDFSKAPIIYYVCYFFLIDVLMNKTFELKKLVPYFSIAIVLVIGLYQIIANYNGKFFSLESGPLSRVVVSQAGTLFLHVDTFPEKLDYLNGHSFPPITKVIFGDGEYDIRSGREVMKIYNEKAIENGTAGVMSTMFLGEAYANFGLLGAFVSPIIVGFICSSIFCLYLKHKKTPLNMVLYLEASIIFIGVLNSGFVEFFYNIAFLVILILIFGIKFLSNVNFLGEKYEI